MRFSRLLIFFVALALTCGFTGVVAKADTVDPAIGIKGGTGSQVLSDPTFSFTFFGGIPGEQDFFFINNTGSTVGEIQMIAPGSPTMGPSIPAPLTYICGDVSTYFNSCMVTPLTDGNSLITYSGGPGIPNDPNPTCIEGDCTPSVAAADFDIFVQDVNGDLAGLSRNDQFTVQGTLIPAPVPEPATIALLSAGLGFLGFSRRRKKQAD